MGKTRGKSGRPTDFTQDKKDEIYDRYKDTFKTGIPGKASSFWTGVKNEFGLPASVTPNSIYVAMSKKHKIQFPTDPISSDVGAEQLNESSSFQEIEESIADSSEVSTEVKDNTNSRKKFQISISMLVWNRIRPETVMYHDPKHKNKHRKYRVLQPGSWTCILAQQIARQHKNITCKWAFERCKVYDDGEHYVVISGHCVTCKAKLDGYLKNKPESPVRTILFQVEASNIDDELHKVVDVQRTVRVTGDFARRIYEKDEPASVTRRNMLKKATGMFQAPTERVLSAPAIRSGKYRLRQLDLLHDCPITALNILKLEVYPTWIQHIGLNPFFVMYGCPDQRSMYKVLRKKNKFVSVSCDATGGVAHKIGILI